MTPLPPYKRPCVTCSTTGLVPRPLRLLPDGSIDPEDKLGWPSVICERCNGSGMEPYDPATVPAKVPT